MITFLANIRIQCKKLDVDSSVVKLQVLNDLVTFIKALWDFNKVEGSNDEPKDHPFSNQEESNPAHLL
jgi:hypothetical protein